MNQLDEYAQRKNMEPPKCVAGLVTLDFPRSDLDRSTLDPRRIKLAPDSICDVMQVRLLLQER